MESALTCVLYLNPDNKKAAPLVERLLLKFCAKARGISLVIPRAPFFGLAQAVRSRLRSSRCCGPRCSLNDPSIDPHRGSNWSPKRSGTPDARGLRPRHKVAPNSRLVRKKNPSSRIASLHGFAINPRPRIKSCLQEEAAGRHAKRVGRGYSAGKSCPQ